MQVLVRLVVGFFRFWYDFIVGDSWEIAAGVAVTLVAGALLLRHDVIRGPYLPLLVIALLMLVLVTSVIVELKRKLAKG